MKLRSLAALAVVVFVSACGGGGGGADAPAYLAGTYKGSYGTTQDNCLVTGGVAGLTNQQVVTLDGSTVRVQINAYSLTGGARDDGGLSAVYEEKSDGITTKLTVTYAMPAGQAAPGNGTFDSELLIQTYADPNSFTCNVRLNGQVVKVG